MCSVIPPEELLLIIYQLRFRKKNYEVTTNEQTYTIALSCDPFIQMLLLLLVDNDNAILINAIHLIEVLSV